MSSQSLQAKQSYLRKNIIEAGYDAEDFVQYSAEKYQLISLDEWNIQKLRRVVQEYVKLKKNKNTEQSEKQINKKIQQENQDNDWNDFQTENSAKEEKISPLKKGEKIDQNMVKNDNLKKLEIKTKVQQKIDHKVVFRDEDWGIFLGQNNIVNAEKTNKQNEKNIKKNVEIPTFEISTNIETIKNTNMNEKKIENFNLKVEQQNKDNLSQSNNIEKIQISNLSKQDNKLVNEYDVVLSTIKSKQMPPLPSITDITVKKTEQVARNFLQSDYTLYYIHFSPGQHVITRKFNDLRKLRNVLSRMFPHLRLPFLESEGWLVNSSEVRDPDILAEHKWMLIEFLKYILCRQNQLKNCYLVRKFCGYPTNDRNTVPKDLDKTEIKKLLQHYESFKKPRYIGQLSLSENRIKIPPISTKQQQLNNFTKISQQIENYYDKLKKQLENLFYNYDLVSKSLIDVENTFTNLQNCIKKYNFQNNMNKDIRVYDGLKQICLQMKNTINDQYMIFKCRIRHIFRYQKYNMFTVKDILDIRNRIHTEYVKQGSPSLSPNSYKNGQIDTSNLNLEEACRNNRNLLTSQEIFWSYMSAEQIIEYWNQLRFKVVQQITHIAYQQLDTLNDSQNFWNLAIKKCVL